MRKGLFHMQNESNLIAFLTSLFTGIGFILLALYKDNRTNKRIDSVEERLDGRIDKETKELDERITKEWKEHNIALQKIDSKVTHQTDLIISDYPDIKTMTSALKPICVKVDNIKSDINTIFNLIDDDRRQKIQALEAKLLEQERYSKELEMRLNNHNDKS